MRRESQVSAFVSEEVREELERYTRATGVKKRNQVAIGGEVMDL